MTVGEPVSNEPIAIDSRGGGKNLIQKAAAVMAAVQHVPKNGRNDFHNYSYATEADITECVRAEMAAQGLMLIPSVLHVEWGTVATRSGVDRLCTLTVEFTLTDGVQDRKLQVLGEGQDRGDKATYKAMTGALKYALLKLFLIPTGDDPEKDAPEDRAPAPRQPQKPQTPKPNGTPKQAAPIPTPAATAPLLGHGLRRDWGDVLAGEKAAAVQDAPRRYDANVIWKRLTHGRNNAQATAFMRNAVGDPDASMSELTQEQLGIVAAELDIDGAP